MYYLGIDLGGTNIKTGVVRDTGEIVTINSSPTAPERGGEDVAKRIAETARSVVADAGLTLENIASIGVGCPGSIDDQHGVVRYAGNLSWRDFPLSQHLSAALDHKAIFLGNDANVAAYGEYRVGSAKDASSAVIVTLGTGVGTGVILDGRILTGYHSGAGELGHMVIEKDGRQCTCGRRGCWEAYSSATGLIAMTREAMAIKPDSAMWEISQEEGEVNGRTAFEAAKAGDAAAISVVDTYISYLACGVANVINGLQPQVVSFGGGVSKQGENLLTPLRSKIAEEVFGGPSQMVTDIRQCTLGNDAGIIGAALLGA